MPLNSTQRPIFVYLRSKNDHKSCTPARAKLTNEYTHWTNKNNPSTISVIPSQLCTFFRKRTVPAEELFGSNRGTQSFQRWKIKFPTLENKVSNAGKKDFLPWKFIFPRLESFWKTYMFCQKCGSCRELSHSQQSL